MILSGAELAHLIHCVRYYSSEFDRFEEDMAFSADLLDKLKQELALLKIGEHITNAMAKGD